MKKKERVYIIIKELQQEKERLEGLLESIINQNEKLPMGRLRCAVNKGCYQYYEGSKYLGKKDRAYAKGLAQRDYNEKAVAVLEGMLKKIEILIRIYEEETLAKIYEGEHPGRQELIEGIVKRKDEYVREWSEEDYEHWEIGEEVNTEYYSIKGERVRSKSEKIIADELARLDIPYKYEYPLILKDGNSTRLLRPDFVCLNKKSLKEYYIEHLGMMDDSNYYCSTMYKLDLYEKNGYLIGKNIILLHETSSKPLSTKVLQNYIKEYLL